MKAAIGFCMLALVCNIWGYPTGAPAPACAKLRPIHMNATAQTSPSPYKIVVTSDTEGDLKWAAGSSLKVMITGATINGFILQARDMSGNGIGSFDKNSLPPGTQQGPCIAADGVTPLSVTHTNPDDKTNLMFVWTAPASGVDPGNIYFQGAVAQSHDVFWVDIKSTDIPPHGL